MANQDENDKVIEALPLRLFSVKYYKIILFLQHDLTEYIHIANGNSLTV